MTKKEIIAEYEIMEKNGVFHQHIEPVNYSLAYPVTENYPFIKKGIIEKSKVFFQKFISKPAIFYLNKNLMKTKVEGRKNLKGLSSAIVTCNHVFMFDCAAIKYALRGKSLKVTGADFNNLKGKLGNLMRAEGLLPISKSLKVMKKLDEAIKYYLSKDKFVLFYPEQAMWYMYDKPRPYKNGAFHFAVKYNVPVLPTFITYRNSGKYDSEGLEIKYFTVHILPPIYPDKNKSEAENVEFLKEENYKACCEVYEKIYGKKVSYTCESV